MPSGEEIGVFDSFHQRIVQFYESNKINYSGEINSLYEHRFQHSKHLYREFISIFIYGP